MRPSPQATGPNQLPLAGLRTIHWILVAMLVLFAAVAYLVHPLLELEAPASESSLLGVVAVLAPLEYVAWRVVARNLQPAWAEAARTWTEGDPLPQAYITRSLLAAAMTCSVGFFTGIIVLMTGSHLALALTVAAVGLLLILLPDVDHVTSTEP